MVQPISLLMSHFNVEHSAQVSREALAAAQQTGQGREVVQESVRRTQRVLAGEAAAEVRRVSRRDEGEEREHRRDPGREENQDGFQASEPAEAGPGTAEQHQDRKSFDFYA